MFFSVVCACLASVAVFPGCLPVSLAGLFFFPRHQQLQMVAYGDKSTRVRRNNAK